MSPEVVQGVNRLISARAPDLQQLSIAWFGGEPLLARQVIREVMEQVCHLRERHPSLHVSSNMTTNAWYLDQAVLAELVGLGVNLFQVTLDGPRQWHDRRRLLAGGGGTFDRIWANLRSLRETEEEFTVEIRLHVDRENAGDIPQFLSQCADSFADDRRFKIFLYPLGRFGGARDSELRTLSCEQGQPLFQELQDLAHALGFESSSPYEKPDACHTARAGAWLIRADGRVGKCPVGLEDPANQLGRINPDGTMNIDNDRFLPWMRGVISGDGQELACPLKGIPGPPADEAEARRRAAAFVEALGRRLRDLEKSIDTSPGV